MCHRQASEASAVPEEVHTGLFRSRGAVVAAQEDEEEDADGVLIVRCVMICTFERSSTSGRLRTAYRPFGLQYQHQNHQNNRKDVLDAPE